MDGLDVGLDVVVDGSVDGSVDDRGVVWGVDELLEGYGLALRAAEIREKLEYADSGLLWWRRFAPRSLKLAASSLLTSSSPKILQKKKTLATSITRKLAIPNAHVIKMSVNHIPFQTPASRLTRMSVARTEATR